MDSGAYPGGRLGGGRIPSQMRALKRYSLFLLTRTADMKIVLSKIIFSHAASIFKVAK